MVRANLFPLHQSMGAARRGREATASWVAKATRVATQAAAEAATGMVATGMAEMAVEGRAVEGRAAVSTVVGTQVASTAAAAVAADGRERSVAQRCGIMIVARQYIKNT